MAKSPELIKKLEEDAEFRFFDSLGNALFNAETYQDSYQRAKKQETLIELQKSKERFYERLDKFKKSGYKPKGKINPESLEKFAEFKSLDWSKSETMETIKEYILSLKPE
jgi:hypothetical protein